MRKALIWLLYGLAFSPLIVMKSQFFPYISGKSIFIRLIVTLVAVGFVWVLFKEKKEIASRARNDRKMDSVSGHGMTERMGMLLKNKVFWFAGAFFVILIVSTIFAVNSYRAFFGDVERAEGLITMLYLFGLFVFAYLLFEKKNWLMFFKLSLLTGGWLFISQLVELSKGVGRPAAQTGNPIYLAAIFLFVIFAGWVVLREEIATSQAPRNDKHNSPHPSYLKRGNPFWKILSAVMIPASVLGIFITETRGVILGVGAGVLAVLAYLLFRRSPSSHEATKDKTRKMAALVLGVLIVLGAVLFMTKDAALWQKIPGFDRVSNFTFQDATTQTRLISAGVSLRAVNPAQNGAGKFLIGYGPENFNIAYNKYYDPEYFRYEQSWFDRAHNKLMDVLVMHGVAGLVAYLGIWVMLWWGLQRKKTLQPANQGSASLPAQTGPDRGQTLRAEEPHAYFTLPILFFSVAYFVQNLFVFDSIVTYVPFFLFLAYAIYNANLQMQNTNATNNSSFSKGGGDQPEDLKSLPLKGTPFMKGRMEIILKWGAGVFVAFYVVAFIVWTWIPYTQTGSYISLLKNKTGTTSVIQSIFEPYTFVQELVRSNFLSNMVDQYEGKESQKELLELGIAQMEDQVEREPYNPRHFIVIGKAYEKLASLGDDAYYKDAENAYRSAMALSPDRQDIHYLLAYNLIHQKRQSDAVTLLRHTIELDPEVSDPHYHLGLILVSGHKYDEGVDELSIAFDMKAERYANFVNFKNILSILAEHYTSIKNAEKLEKVRNMQAVIASTE